MAALQRTSCRHPDQSPTLLPSFPRKTLLVGLKERRKVKGKEVKEKATFGKSLPVSPALKGKVSLERRMCVGGKSQLCHSEWIHQDVDVKSGFPCSYSRRDLFLRVWDLLCPRSRRAEIPTLLCPNPF